jgi:hypothetical protein
MAVTSQCKIALRPGSIFCFGIILSVADEKGILHRIADPQEKKLSLEIPRKARTRQRTAQPPVPQAKTTSCKPRTGNVLARRTLLPTSPTKEWTRITRKREASVPRKGTELRRVIFPSPSPSKKDGKELATTVTPFYPSSSGGGGEIGVVSHLQQRTGCARGRASPARSSATKEQTLEYSATSRGWGTGPSAARILR